MSTKAREFFTRAMTKFENGDSNGGLLDLGMAIELEPDNVQYRCVRGERLVSLHHYFDALVDLDMAIKIGVSEIDEEKLRRYRVLCLLDLHKYNEVFDDTDWLIAHGHETSQIRAWRSLSLAKKGDYESALRDLDVAIQIAPTTPNIVSLLDRANIYIKLKAFPKALLDLDTIIESNICSPEFLYLALHTRSSVYNFLGDHEKAANDTRQMTELRRAI